MCAIRRLLFISTVALFHFVCVVAPLRHLRLFAVISHRIRIGLARVRMQIGVFTFRCGGVQMKWYRIALIHMLFGINGMRLLWLLSNSAKKKNIQN